MVNVTIYGIHGSYGHKLGDLQIQRVLIISIFLAEETMPCPIGGSKHRFSDRSSGTVLELEIKVAMEDVPAMFENRMFMELPSGKQTELIMEHHHFSPHAR